jgi:hypothetical protein
MPIVATVAAAAVGPATLVFPTSPAVATFVATVFPTLAAVMTPLGGQMGNGEPDIVLLPPGQTSQNALAAAAVQAQVQPTPIPSVATPVSARSGLRIFDRPANEVLTWLGIMLGALAIIGILVALIWQASRRDETIP